MLREPRQEFFLEFSGVDLHNGGHYNRSKGHFPMSRLSGFKAQLLPLVRKRALLKLSEPIQLASGKMSDVYFDGRKVTLDPEGITLFARAILELVKLDSIDAVGGPAIGADPIATAVSIFAYLDKHKRIPAFVVRKESKQHGLQKQVEGAELKPGMKVLMVEDVITTGQSVRNAISVVEGFGAEVVQVVCLVDRGEGDGKLLSPYSVTPLFTRKEIES